MLSCWDPDELEFVGTTRLLGAGKVPYAEREGYMPFLLLPVARHSSAICTSLWECVKDLQGRTRPCTAGLLAIALCTDI